MPTSDVCTSAINVFGVVSSEASTTTITVMKRSRREEERQEEGVLQREKNRHARAGVIICMIVVSGNGFPTQYREMCLT